MKERVEKGIRALQRLIEVGPPALRQKARDEQAHLIRMWRKNEVLRCVS